MSIARIQKERVFEEITRYFLAKGHKPRVIDLLTDISHYFARNPAGRPLTMPVRYIEQDKRSNVDRFNELMLNIAMNLDVAYEASNDHLDEVMMMTTVLRSHLDRLSNRRKALEAKIDDYLFSLYNTDGYFFSISDTFANLDLVDMSMTSAYVDTTVGSVTLPTVSSLTKTMTADRINGTQLRVLIGGKPVAYQTKSSFSSAVDGLTNTAWSIEVDVPNPVEVVAELSIVLGSTAEPVKVSRVEFDPFGISPVQLFMQGARRAQGTTNNDVFDFGDRIKTSANKMVFTTPAKEVTQLRFTMRKTEPDYVVTSGDSFRHRYIFGAKEIAITEHVYDNTAIFVSAPLAIADELTGDNVIDAVSLVTFDDIPPDTSIDYFVAAEPDILDPTLSDFEWREIDPLAESVEGLNSIIYFNGARSVTKKIVDSAQSADELQLIEPDATNSDLTKRNPSPVVFPGLEEDIWRIAKFTDPVLKESLVLEEGVNTVRILHVDTPAPELNIDPVSDLNFWTEYVQGTKTTADLVEVYSSIENSTAFLDGGDIGADEKSVYVETYLESLTDQELILKTLTKDEINAVNWDVKVFLNGREIGYLPPGTKSLLLPWKFNQGLNHIAMTVNIPAATTEMPSPSLGAINLMVDTQLYQLGQVKLGTWTYVDAFQIQYNEGGTPPRTFTIYNGEIISRRKPTTNFRLRYSLADNGPSAIRVRADLGRSILNPHITPALESYRLRFLYS